MAGLDMVLWGEWVAVVSYGYHTMLSQADIDAITAVRVYNSPLVCAGALARALWAFFKR